MKPWYRNLLWAYTKIQRESISIQLDFKDNNAEDIARAHHFSSDMVQTILLKANR